jgi:rhodanese-related sulfurtransferase
MDGRYEFHESDWKLFRKKIVDWQEDPMDKLYKEYIALLSEDKELIILDVRTRDEYIMGHIKGAINIPNETISNTKPDLLPDTDKTILVYCQGGMRAGSAVRKLKRMGYKHAYNMGGITSWTGEVVR